jgi:nucleoside-diphosphate-sugar epimerase
VKVVVTGGSGLLGSHVVADLSHQGYDVSSVDITPPPNKYAPHRLVDMEDFGQVCACLAGADVVIHLAAIPRPVFHTNNVVFRTNVMAFYNVLEAGATLGIRRVLFASSVSVLGFPFFYRPLSPAYVPVDETHPALPQDPYALSKRLGEEMAQAFARRCDMTVISLRFPWIHTPETFKEQIVPLWDDPVAGASNLWSYIDARDAAQSCRLALHADIHGHEPFFVAAPDTFMKTPTVDLVHRCYPDAEIRPGLDGRQSLLNSAKASKILNYKPLYTWESYF